MMFIILPLILSWGKSCQSRILSDGKFIGFLWNLSDFPDWETIYWICTRLSSAVVDQEHKNMKLLEILFQIKFIIYLANCIHSSFLWRFLRIVFPKMRTLPKSLSGIRICFVITCFQSCSGTASNIRLWWSCLSPMWKGFLHNFMWGER